MDEIDVLLLRALQEDARLSCKELGERIGLSLPATRERLRKLERGGYILGYTVLLDAERLGKTFGCFCMVILKEHDHAEDFLAFVQECPDILECHRVTGSYEYILKVVTTSPKALEALLSRLRERCSVAKSSTFTMLSSIKVRASIPPD